MRYLILLLTIAWSKVKPVRRVVQHNEDIDIGMRAYLKAYASGSALDAECAAWIYYAL